MRLYITVQRHNLPDFPVVWNVDLEASTISELLRQVNDAIPIEDSEWGCEDYAVELKGANGASFECLHYQVVGKVLKEDDVVFIRPLLSQDLKIRKLSGRHQISSDGRHLVDGLTFGRPLLRRPRPADRPPVNIPPRKKRRITYNKDDEGDEEELLALNEREAVDSNNSIDDTNNRHLVVHADFDDEDSEDDDDFAPEEDAEVDESENDFSSDDNTELDSEKDEQQDDIPKGDGEADHGAALSDVSDESARAKIRKLHSAFPKAPMTVCKYILLGSNGDLDEAYETMTIGFRPKKSKSSITENSQEDLKVPKSRKKAPKAVPYEPEEQDDMEVEADEQEDPMLAYYDQNGLPAGSITTGKALSAMAKALNSSPSRTRPISRGSTASNKSVRFAVDGELSPGLMSTPWIDQESGVEESNESSSDDSSSSGSSSDNESEKQEISEQDESEISDTSTSGSDSDSESESDSDGDSDDPPEETSSRPISTVSVTPKLTKAPSQQISIPSVGPGSGSRSTRMRNGRRRNANLLARYKNKGILPAGTTLSELSKLTLTPDTSPEEAKGALEAIRSNKIATETEKALTKKEVLEAAKQELFARIASEGGIEVDLEPSPNSRKRPHIAREDVVATSSAESHITVDPPTVSTANAFSMAQEPHATPKRTETALAEPSASLKEATPGVSGEPPGASATSKPVTGTHVPTTPSAESAKGAPRPGRRAPADAAAARRMIFASLGVKNPRTKQDEENVRNKLMKDIRPVAQAQQAVEGSVSIVAAVAQDEDPEAWRKFINYRAVECCHDDVELSEPPFPFVQRWDPQQRLGRHGKQKRKRDQWANTQQYDEQPGQKKRKNRKGKHDYDDYQQFLDASYEPSYQDYSMMYDEPQTQETRFSNDGIERDINEQPSNFANKEAVVSQVPDDLTPLPDDPSTLPDLEPGQARVGMTIAFKELEMSEATRWAPQLSAYKTAIVILALDGGELHLALAQRDRKRSEASYDAETGERIYGKFEMPVDEEDEELEEDGGMLVLSFGELHEAKIVAIHDGNDAAENDSQAKGDPSSGGSVTLSHEDESAEAQLSHQLSHVTETPLHSDAVEPDNDSCPNHSVVSEREARHIEFEASPPAQEALELRQEISQQNEGIKQPEHRSHSGDLLAQVNVAAQDAALPEQEIVQSGHDSASHKEPLAPEQQSASPLHDTDQMDEGSLGPDQDVDTHIDAPAIEQDLSSLMQEGQDSGGSRVTVTIKERPEEFLEEAIISALAEGRSQPIAQLEQDASKHGGELNQPHQEPVMGKPKAEVAQQEDIVPDEESNSVAVGINPPEEPALPVIETESLTESVSDEARQDISHLMREEGGFRSSVSSTIGKVIRPAGMDSPGDDAVFEKLMRDMEVKYPPYSPKFTGLGSSSPIRNRLRSISPLESEPHLPSSPITEQSSWQTIASGEPSSPPARDEQTTSVKEAVKDDEDDEEDEDEESWETIPSSPPKKRKSSLAKLLKSKPFGKAQALWEQLQPRSRETSVRVSVEGSKVYPDPFVARNSAPPRGRELSVRVGVEDSREASPVPSARCSLPPKSRECSVTPTVQIRKPKPSPRPSMTVDGVAHRDVIGDIQYPQLSVGSSFTSQVSDHGRQPDAVFDDNLGLRANTPKAPGFEDGSFQPSDAIIETDDEPLGPPVQDSLWSIWEIPNDSLSEAEFPSPKIGEDMEVLREAPSNIQGRLANVPEKSEVSSDEFPDLDVVFSQPTASHVKREKSTSVPFKEYKKSIAPIEADLSDEDQDTPKASQLFVRPSQPRPFQNRKSRSHLPKSEDRKSQSRASQSRDYQRRGSVDRGSQPPAGAAASKAWDGSIPAGSQVMDLTLSSSDVEPEPEVEVEKDEKIFPKKFRMPSFSDADDDYEPSPSSQGWVNKKVSSQQATRRYTDVDSLATSSSQASSNPKRKTSSRF